MNLIEQLGGYERAKAFLNATSYTIDELIMMQRSGLRTQHVEKALLEYRRQHNIFEVGDWIFIVGTTDISQFIGYVHKGTHAELPQIKLNGVLYSSCFGAWVHATDEEIKAGRRL